MPTRLLDWTANVLIAAYFACQNKGKNKNENAAIYALHIGATNLDIEKITDEPYCELENNQIFSFEPPHIHPRILAQQSYFTLQSHKFYFSPELKTNYRMHTCRIDRKSERSILHELNQIGINAYTISPDLSGLGQSIKWDYFGIFDK